MGTYRPKLSALQQYVLLHARSIYPQAEHYGHRTFIRRMLFGRDVTSSVDALRKKRLIRPLSFSDHTRLTQTPLGKCELMHAILTELYGDAPKLKPDNPAYARRAKMETALYDYLQ